MDNKYMVKRGGSILKDGLSFIEYYKQIVGSYEISDGDAMTCINNVLQASNLSNIQKEYILEVIGVVIQNHNPWGLAHPLQNFILDARFQLLKAQ
jgi:hypothetical protein